MLQILEIVIFMVVIAVIAFAPLGYFIYLFTMGNGESFGKSNPEDHSVEHTSYYKYIDFLLSTLLGGTDSAKATTQAASMASSATTGLSDAANPKPRPRPRTSSVPSGKKAKDKKKKSKKK